MLPWVGMFTPNMEIDSLAEMVIGCAIKVHREMGPGLTEPIYEECMLLELQMAAIPFQCERRLPIAYRETVLKTYIRIDILVDNRLILELKAVDSISGIHKAQVIAYLKLTGFPAGLLINFNEPTLVAGVRRLDHPDIYVRKRGATRSARSEP